MQADITVLVHNASLSISDISIDRGVCYQECCLMKNVRSCIVTPPW